jgi:hypothetical protein
VKRSALVLIAVAILGLLAGFAIAGMPTEVDKTIINQPVSTGDVSVPVTDAGESTTATDDTTADAATTTAASAFDKSAVRVVIANATTRQLVARATADKLIAAGFTDTHPVNALRSLLESVVYVRPGFEQAAAAVAKQIALDPAIVQPLTTGQVTAADDRGDVIVVLGKDFVG